MRPHELDSLLSPASLSFDASPAFKELFKNHEMYLQFVMTHRTLYDNEINKAITQQEKLHVKTRYEEALQECLGTKTSKPVPLSGVVRSLQELLSESTEREQDGTTPYCIRLDNLVIEGKDKTEAERIYKNFKLSYEEIVKDKPEVEEALRNRLEGLRRGGPTPNKTIQTYIKATNDFSQFIPWQLSDRQGMQQIIEWNQYSLIIDKGADQNVRTIIAAKHTLVHESEHAFSAVFDPIGQKVRENFPCIGRRFTHKEEEHVCLGIEARALGTQRVSSQAWTLSTDSIHSREPMLRIKRGSAVMALVPEHDITGVLRNPKGKTVEIEDKRTGEIVLHRRDELANLIDMNPDLRLSGSSPHEILDDAIAHDDEIKIRLKKGAIEQGELRTLENPAQLARFQEVAPKVDILQQDLKSTQGIMDKAGSIFRGKPRPIIVDEDSVQAMDIVTGKIVSDAELRRKKITPSPGYIHVKEINPSADGRRFYKISTSTLSESVDKLSGKSVRMFFRGAIFNENRAIAKELNTEPFTVVDAKPGVTQIRGTPFKPDGADKIFYVQDNKVNGKHEVIRMAAEELLAKGRNPPKMGRTRKDNKKDSFTAPSEKELEDYGKKKSKKAVKKQNI